MERVEYPLSPKYVPKWSVIEALRELIANALDTNSETQFYWEACSRKLSKISEGGAIRC